MQIKQNSNKYTIIADNGKRIIQKNNPSISFKTLTVPKNYSLSRFVEIDDTNIVSIEQNIVHNEAIKQYDNLTEAKQALIKSTKTELEKFLSNNPIRYKDKFYSVSTTSQQHLDSLIAAAEDAEKLNIAFTPYWNDISEKRQIWSLYDLKMLRIQIQKYILPYILQQQTMEETILYTNSLQELYALNLSYQKQLN